MNTAYLLLGSNMGDRQNFLSRSIELIEKSAGKIIARSSLYNTQAWGHTDQGDFLNQAVQIETLLSAHELLHHILRIEEKLGRIRMQKWEARIIDIDILFYNAEVIQTPDLIVPHPFLHERKFVLSPLSEIAGDLIHPILKKSVKKMLSECDEKLLVSRL